MVRFWVIHHVCTAGHNPQEAYIINTIELEAELEHLQAAKHLAGIGLLASLKCLSDSREHQILLLRYLNHKTLAEIAIVLDRTRSPV